MDAGPTLNHKPTIRFNYASSSRPASRNNSRPGSPTKAKSPEPPLFRPKAKINSSATARTGKASSTVSVNDNRPASPSKLSPRVRNGVITTPKVKSTIGLGVKTPVSAPVTPESRKRTLATTIASENVSPFNDSRSRAPSVSLHHAASFSSFKASQTPNLASSSSPRLTASKSIVNLSDREDAPGPSNIRIRSKVSGLAKSTSASSDVASTTGSTSPTVSQQPLPLFPSTMSRPGTVRARAPSTSSNVSHHQQPSSPPIPQFYPITTSSPAANPHRFTSPRPPPVATSSYVNAFQGFTPSSTSTSTSPAAKPPRIGTGTGMARVDMSSIMSTSPPPPHSPPVSALSFSSRSSVSASKSSGVSRATNTSSTSTSTDGSPRAEVDLLRSTLEGLVQYTSNVGEVGHEREEDRDGAGAGGDEHEQERKIKAEAKSNRKIEDLEISNRSLLAINASLEATKNRQAKEIRELRRKLRESRLLLPPKTFHRVKSSLDPSEGVDDEEDIEEDGEDEEMLVMEGEGDERYRRIKGMIDGLLRMGREALEKEVRRDSITGGTGSGTGEGVKGGTKVLSPEEVRNWNGDAEDGDGGSDQETEYQDKSVDENSIILVNEDDDDEGDFFRPQDVDSSFDSTLASEDEVEDMMLLPTSPPTSPPPIFIVTKPT